MTFAELLNLRNIATASIINPLAGRIHLTKRFTLADVDATEDGGYYVPAEFVRPLIMIASHWRRKDKQRWIRRQRRKGTKRTK